MTRDTIAAALMVWLIGAVVGWCAGWAARREQNHRWHRNVVRQLAQARTDLEQTLDQLDHARSQCEAERLHAPAAAPAVVHVHLAAPLPWAPLPPPTVIDTARFLDARPILPAKEVQS